MPETERDYLEGRDARTQADQQDRARYCCDDMRAQLNWTCDMHKYRSECPDALIGRLSDATYGILIHDGGASMSEINYCPWCGTPVKGWLG